MKKQPKITSQTFLFEELPNSGEKGKWDKLEKELEKDFLKRLGFKTRKR